MKLKNTSYIFLLLFFFTSCVAKKSTIEYKERIVRDTINIEVVKTIVKPIKETLIIEKPCDSLGNLKQFEKEIKTPKGSVKLTNDKGKIKVEINIDSIIEVKEKEFKSKYQSKVDIKEVEVIRYKYPLWLMLTAFISIIINLAFLKRWFL